MQKLPDNFIKERYKKDERYIIVYDTYRPNYNETNVTAKFYSKYEGHLDTEASPAILENLKRANDYGPKEKLAWPETENHWYGWYSDPLVELERSDGRLYFPRASTEMTRHGLKILQTNKKSKK
ncbi:unnamed protein product [Phaedon cochleariae]|uniref:Uncharacterized protein n=1 Tax=Phaedon cochleariae TaxID=80249 RepID=A0A9P0DH09_PHACE|nr:unnamed protein product [Phaedon cochleariae]